MDRLDIVEFLAQGIVDSTECMDELDGNIDFDIDALKEEVREKAEELAKTSIPTYERQDCVLFCRFNRKENFQTYKTLADVAMQFRERGIVGPYRQVCPYYGGQKTDNGISTPNDEINLFWAPAGPLQDGNILSLTEEEFNNFVESLERPK